MRTIAPLLVLPVVAALSGCNRYELFRLAGYEQSAFVNEADVLFVVDNSPSMFNEASALGLNFNAFIEQLVDPETGTGVATDGLSDAVDNYVQYVNHRGRFIDYHLGVITTTVELDDGVLDPGEAGLLMGDPAVIEKTLDDVPDAFRQTVLCEATCWPGECTGDFQEDCIPYDPEYECGDDPGDQISWEYLDCVCGNSWQKPECGSGTEEGLEAALLALCRAAENPPDVCFEICQEDPYGEPSCHTNDMFTEDDVGTNAGFLRDGSNIIVVIVTDEGDGSRRMTQGDSDPTPYLEAFASFDQRVTFAIIGANYDPEAHTLDCNSGGATTWGTERYQIMASQTGGFYRSIEQEIVADECAVTDFATHLADLGNLINSLLNNFPLQSIPDPSTILVYVDGAVVPEASCIEHCEVDATLDPVYEDGWSYEPAINAVVFHGDAVPDYNADVRIYYRPVSELPRDLPF